MIRHNSPKRIEALEELRNIISETMDKDNSQRARLKLYHYTEKYLPPGQWNSAKSFWRKLL